MAESVSQLPLKDKAFLYFLGQNPPFELRPKVVFRVRTRPFGQRPVIDNNAIKRRKPVALAREASMIILVPYKRIGEPDDNARTAVWLPSVRRITSRAQPRSSTGHDTLPGICDCRLTPNESRRFQANQIAVGITQDGA